MPYFVWRAPRIDPVLQALFLKKSQPSGIRSAQSGKQVTSMSWWILYKFTLVAGNRCLNMRQVFENSRVRPGRHEWLVMPKPNGGDSSNERG